MSELYKLVMVGKKRTYRPVTDYELKNDFEPVSKITFTGGQCITLAGTLGLTLLMTFAKHIPPHKRSARKIKAVETAVLDLFQGTGEPFDRDVADQFCRAWDETMLRMTA